MKILLQYGPEHGRVLTGNQTRAAGDEVRVVEGRYVYVLTDKEDERGRRIATVYND